MKKVLHKDPIRNPKITKVNEDRWSFLFKKSLLDIQKDIKKLKLK